MEHWQKLCLVFSTWDVPLKEKATYHKSKEKLNSVPKLNYVLINSHQQGDLI